MPASAAIAALRAPKIKTPAAAIIATRRLKRLFQST
jgi:hypothetical protein